MIKDVQKCDAAYDIQGTECYLHIANCNEYYPSGDCKNCINLYDLYNNKCYDDVVNCE